MPDLSLDRTKQALAELDALPPLNTDQHPSRVKADMRKIEAAEKNVLVAYALDTADINPGLLGDVQRRRPSQNLLKFARSMANIT